MEIFLNTPAFRGSDMKVKGLGRAIPRRFHGFSGVDQDGPLSFLLWGSVPPAKVALASAKGLG
jgi:hypothetical protein